MADDGAPLATRLSQALVAFTLEVDDAFESRMPHRTTEHSTTGGGRVPWLVSWAMWATCARWVPDDGISVADLAARARIDPPAMQAAVQRMSGWWGYLTVTPKPSSKGTKPTRKAVVTPTRNGRKAQEVWDPLGAEVEQRWRDRLGHRVDDLLAALGPVADAVGPGLPDHLPPMGDVARTASDAPSEQSLWAGLARVLMAFTLDHDAEARVPLRLAANVLRAVPDGGTRVTDLPALTGLAPPAAEGSTKRLTQWKLLEAGSDPAGGRARWIQPTDRGRRAQQAHHRRVRDLEASWPERLGVDVGDLRAALAAVVGDGTAAGSPLAPGLVPSPDSWRAEVPRPDVLAHYPMVSARGGYPDGA